jgi:hypothetical protein
LALQNLSAAHLLSSQSGRGTILGDLQQFGSLVDSNNFNVRLVIPLLKKVIGNASNVDIWDAIYSLVTESMPPPRLLSYLDRTPISFNTGSLANTFEYREYFDDVLKDKLDLLLYINISALFDAFFVEIMDLELVAQAVFKKCQEGKNPLYKEGEEGS